MGTCLTLRSKICNWMLVWNRSRRTTEWKNMSSFTEVAIGRTWLSFLQLLIVSLNLQWSTSLSIGWSQLLGILSLGETCFHKCDRMFFSWYVSIHSSGTISQMMRLHFEYTQMTTESFEDTCALKQNDMYYRLNRMHSKWAWYGLHFGC